MLRWLPNALTLLRVGLALAFPFVPAQARVAVLGAALLTEVLDGALARRFGWESSFGRVLDPIADRCVFVAVALTLVSDGTLTWPMLAMLGARDLLVSLGAAAIVVRGHRRLLSRLHPRWPGKATTALQYVAAFALLLDVPLRTPLPEVTLVLGLLAAARYLSDYRAECRGLGAGAS